MALALEQAGDEPQTFFHRRTLLPGHLHLPPHKRKVLPMCPVRTVTYVSGRSQLAEEFKYSASQPVDGQAMTRYCKRHLPRPERLGISLIERFRIDVVLAGSDR